MNIKKAVDAGSVVQQPQEVVDALKVLRGEGKLDSHMEARISTLHDACFACGEWDKNESDEEYDDVLERSTEATRELRKQIVRTVLEYGRVGDEMLRRISEPDDDSELLRQLADYIEQVCETSKDVPEFAAQRERKLAQVARLRELADDLAPGGCLGPPLTPGIDEEEDVERREGQPE